MPEATIASFILRFMREQNQAGRTWRGLIRHVQSGDQAHFIRIEDALAFAARYIDITPAQNNSNPNQENEEEF